MSGWLALYLTLLPLIGPWTSAASFAGLFVVLMCLPGVRHGMFRSIGAVEALMTAYAIVVGILFFLSLPEKSPRMVRADLYHFFFNLAVPFCLFALARAASTAASVYRISMMMLVTVAGTYVIVTGIADYLTDWTFFFLRLDGTHLERVKGSMLNAIIYGAVASMLAVASLGLTVSEDSRRRRMVWAVLAGLLILVAVLSKSRVTWLGLPLALAYLSCRGWPLRRPLTVAAGVAAIAYGAVVATDSVLDAFPVGTAATGQATGNHGPAPPTIEQVPMADRLADTDSLENRVGSYGTALAMVADRPFFGHGPGIRTYAENKLDYLQVWFGIDRDAALYPNTVHNEVLSQFVQIGLCGGGVFLLMLWCLWRCANDRTERTRIAGGTAAAAFILLGVVGMLHDVNHMRGPLALFFFFLGLIRGQHLGQSRNLA